MTSRRFAIFLLIIVLLFSRCSMITSSAGGETTNGRISGALRNSDGSYGSGTQVRLFPANYDPVKDTAVVPSDTTDALGNYTFCRVLPGDYSILAVHIAHRTRTLVTGIKVADDTSIAPVGTLLETARLKVALPDEAGSAAGYVYIPGTPHFVLIDSPNGFVVLDSIPAVVVPMVVYSPLHGATSTIIRYDASVSPGGTTVVSNPSWKYARKLCLNTSPTGANVAGDVANFPVLIRLNGDNFTFAQAQENGADLRFTRSGNALPYEIEHWDPANQRAEAWVKVDTIRGDDSSQFIMMYWGNPDAADSSSSAAVFDTANGFAGVWHLDESEGTLDDATANRYVGNRFGSQSRTDGEIGYGQTYLDSGDYTDMENVLNPDTSNFTVSAWVIGISLSGTYTVMGKSDGGAPHTGYGWLMTFTSGCLRFMMVSKDVAWGDTGTFLLQAQTALSDTGAWHYVAAVIDRSGNGSCRLFIDGADVTDLRVGSVANVGAIFNHLNMRFGIEADNGFPLKACLDEATVSYAARSPDWIKLCYMNQRSDDRFVVFR
ncbi:MAG: DUF2341 domain-containing protein [Chitinispirillaceae bacterium]|nr:DUF2341 domain-containing protein [Chitinispirillaceae bacterium]